MKKKIICVLATSVLLSSFSSIASAKEWSTLSNPQWTQSTKDEFLDVKNDIHLATDQKLVYLHMQDEKTYTKIWNYDTLNAVDPDTGKTKWIFPFFKEGIGYLTTEYPFMYGKNGTTYAYFESNRLLYSINAKGKQNWMIELPEQQHPDAVWNNPVHLMKDGTLLYIVPKSTKTGNETTIVYGYNKNGKQIFKKLISGHVEKVTDTYVIVQNQSVSFNYFKSDVYNTAMKRLYRYEFPKGATTDIGYTTVWDDGTVLFRADLPKTGNRLIAISPQGKVLWTREVPGNAEIREVGNYYIVYVDKTVSLYDSKGFVAKHAFDHIDDEVPIYPSARMTDDHKIWLDLVIEQYVLDPKDMSVIQNFKLNNEDTKIMQYDNNIVYTLDESKNKVSKYQLK